MRGIRCEPAYDAGKMRISPAHAGNTTSYSFCCQGMGDQPRTCGEYDRHVVPGLSTLGSAPHMRGIPSQAVLWLREPRISPAHAGNTRKVYSVDFTIWDQPRTCGEYSPGMSPGRMLPGSAPHMRGIHSPPGGGPVPKGSAPHMRGIRRNSFRRRRVGRISPAHAGNTSSRYC